MLFCLCWFIEQDFVQVYFFEVGYIQQGVGDFFEWIVLQVQVSNGIECVDIIWDV